MIAENKNILLVEDQLIIGLHQKIELEKNSYSVTHVASGEEALAAALNKENRFDLILMDIDLGTGIDGIEAAKQIIDKKDIPILFHSSHTEPEVVAKTEEVTSYGYVVKNSGITVLDASIKMAFKLFEAKQNEQIARQKAEGALIISENSLDQIIDHMMEGFLILEPLFNEKGNIFDTRYIRINPAIEKMTGLSKTDLMGNTTREVFNNNVESIYFEEYEEVYKTGIPSQFTSELKGINKWYEVSVYKVDQKKLAIFFHDITERKLAEEALKESENKYRSLFDYMAQEVHFW